MNRVILTVFRDFYAIAVILHRGCDFRRFMWKFSTKEVTEL